MKRPSIQMTTGTVVSVLIFGWFLYRITHPCTNLWEESRSNSIWLKLLEPSTPMFITIWSIIYAYRASIAKSNKVTHVQEKKELWPTEAWAGAVSAICLFALLSMNAVDHRTRRLATKIEHIICLCNNDKELQSIYLSMENSNDLEKFISLASEKGQSNPKVVDILNTLGYY